MPPAVHVIGTGHHYQFGAGVKFGQVECSSADAHAFAEYLLQLAKTTRARLIAEELNFQALHEVGASISVPQQVAALLCISHLFCEPDREERASLGIMDENTVRALAFMEHLPEPVIQARLQDHWRRREEEWHKRIAQAALSPVLFVCGSNHSNTFSELLRTHGVEVTVEQGNWEA